MNKQAPIAPDLGTGVGMRGKVAILAKFVVVRVLQKTHSGLVGAKFQKCPFFLRLWQKAMAKTGYGTPRRKNILCLFPLGTHH